MFTRYLLRDYPYYNKLYHRDVKNITAFGMHQGEKLLLTAGFDCPVLYVAADYLSAQNMLRQLTELEVTCLYLPYAEEPLLHRRSVSNSFVFDLSSALDALLDGDVVLVTCAEALASPLPDHKQFNAKRYVFSVGEVIDRAEIIRRLVDCGYKRVEGLTTMGEFTVRGDIIDVAAAYPVRISLDYDCIESIKHINEDLTSGDSLDCFRLFPLAFGVTEQLLAKAKDAAAKQRLNHGGRTRIDSIISDIETSPFSRWLFAFDDHSALNDYLPEQAVVVWEEPKMLQEKVERVYTDFDRRTKDLINGGEILPAHIDMLLPRSEVFDSLKAHAQIGLQQLNYGGTFFAPDDVISFTTAPLYNYQYNPKQIAFDYEQWAKSGYDVFVFSGDEEAASRTLKQLEILGVSCIDNTVDAACKGNNAVILPLFLEKGFVSHSNKLVILGIKDLGGKPKQRQSQSKSRRLPLTVKAGDYVVHELHGIGRCEGITTVSGSWGKKDFILVTYKNNDKLYVPVTNVSALSRFSGSDKTPALSTIGGKDFERVKSKVKSAIKAMSFDLLKLYAAREGKRGRRYNIDSYLCKAFDDSFPYAETPDQLTAIADIDKDLTSNDIMDRLLVGDVGYGKTEVALRAAFKVISNGYQVALLAPTTILTQQHYETAKQRMEAFGIKIACLNRFRSDKEQKEILRRLAQGEIDLVIGTHRLLSNDVSFSKLGLLILDEEQRFGVEHKERIKNLKTDVDALTMSATPIPRTLYMAITGIRDISVINTPPLKRIAVETYVIEENMSLLREIILRELSRDGQVFLVYNRVDGIEFFTERIRHLIPEAKIVMAHGQMDSDVLENAVYDFASGKSNLLISTTIIENGIDMPNANTLIVFDADRLGLSQLYQLRGRVGRSDRPAYAYFVYRQDKVLSQTAYERLSSITEYSQLGSGFKIAMRDLEIRGAGNILGAEQHGNMQKVGYDMYTRLLRETLAELKGKPVEKEYLDVAVESDLPCYAPEYYIASSEERMNLYQRASAIENVEEADKIAEDLTDIYGAPPQSVLNLLCAVKVRRLAALIGIDSVTIELNTVKLHFSSKDSFLTEKVFALINADNDRIKVGTKQIELLYTFDTDVDTLQQTLDLLKRL